MNSRDRNENTHFWLIIVGFLTAQMALIVVLLRRVFQRAEAPTLPPQPFHIDAYTPETVVTPPESPQQPSILPDRATKQKPEPGLNWDVLGIASAAITLISAAIFYVAGWVYEAHWHSYFGINTSQIDLVPANVMIQGMPGIFLLGCTTLLGFGIIGVSKRLLTKVGFKIQDIPIVILFAYALSTLILAIVLTIPITGFPTIFKIGPPLLEVWIALIPGMLIAIISVGIFWLAVLANIKPAWFLAIVRAMPVAFALSSLSLPSTQTMSIVVEKALEELVDESGTSIVQLKSRQIVKAVTESWQFWLGLVLLMFFLLSIATSAILGEYDARQGVRSLDGNWHIPMVNILSDQPILALEEFSIATEQQGCEYGVFGLVSQGDAKLFLVKWEDIGGWVSPPIYVVSNHRGIDLHLLPVHRFLERAPVFLESPLPTPISEQQKDG